MKESKLWLLHLMSGILLLFLLGTHTLIMHFDTVLGWLGLGGGNPLDFATNVLPRMQAVSHTVIYLFLLVFGLFHGLYGVRSLIYEFHFAAKAKHVVGYLLLLVGLTVGAWGAYTILAGHLNPPAVPSAATAPVNPPIGG
jgi:succinate dehydrogenase / fumarate reductase membrane anchor subunit